MTPGGSPRDVEKQASRADAYSWLLASALHQQTAALEWTTHGVALLTAGITWDAVRVPYALLDPEYNRRTELGDTVRNAAMRPELATALRKRLEDFQVVGSVFCDPYRPNLYFMVPPGTDRRWPRRNLGPIGVECLGGTRPYIHHVGVPRVDQVAPPGPYWLTPPDSGVPRHVIAKRLYEMLHACIVQAEAAAPTTP